MLISALSFHLKLKEDLEGTGFAFNLHDVCAGNHMVDENQHRVCFHMDDLMSNHEDSKINDEFLEWLNQMHGECSKVMATRGNEPVCLGMNEMFKQDRSVEIDMKECIRNVLQEFPMKFKSEGK